VVAKIKPNTSGKNISLAKSTFELAILMANLKNAPEVLKSAHFSAR
jgi:hypothetical protein